MISSAFLRDSKTVVKIVPGVTNGERKRPLFFFEESQVRARARAALRPPKQMLGLIFVPPHNRSAPLRNTASRAIRLRGQSGLMFLTVQRGRRRPTPVRISTRPSGREFVKYIVDRLYVNRFSAKPDPHLDKLSAPPQGAVKTPTLVEEHQSGLIDFARPLLRARPT